MNPTVVLRSERLELRALDRSDARFVESLYASAEVTRTRLRIQGPISMDAAREYCETPPTACGEHHLGAALKADGGLIAVGSVRVDAAFPGVASIGHSVVPAFWGQGFGTELAVLLVEFAAATVGAAEIRATTLDDNPASARVLQKVGFAVLECGVREVDSRRDVRHVTRWFHRPAGDSPSTGARRPADGGRTS